MPCTHSRISSQWFRYQALQLACINGLESHLLPNALNIGAFIQVYHADTVKFPVCDRNYVRFVVLPTCRSKYLRSLWQVMIASCLQTLKRHCVSAHFTTNRIQPYLVCISTQIWTYGPSARWLSSRKLVHRHPEIFIRCLRRLPLDHIFINVLRQFLHTLVLDPALQHQVDQQVLDEWDGWSRDLCSDFSITRQTLQSHLPRQGAKWGTSPWSYWKNNLTPDLNLAQIQGILCCLRTETAYMILFQLTLFHEWRLCQRYCRFMQRRLGDPTAVLWYRTPYQPLYITPLWPIYAAQIRWITYVSHAYCPPVELCYSEPINMMFTSSEALIKLLYESALCTAMGGPRVQSTWLRFPDEQIVSQSCLLYKQYHELYSGTLNASWLTEYLYPLLRSLCFKTLAWKHKTHVSSVLVNPTLINGWSRSIERRTRPIWYLRCLPQAWR